MNSDDISPDFKTVLERINKKTGDRYCALCDVKTGNAHNFAAHVVGRKHLLQLKRIENSGFQKWAKKEAKKARRKIKKVVETEQSEKSIKKIRKGSVSLKLRSSRVLKELTPEEKPDSKSGKSGGDVKEIKDYVNSKTHDSESSSSNYTKLVETSHSKISSGASSSSSLEKISVVQPPKDCQTESFPVSSPSFCSTKMYPQNFNLPSYNVRAPFPRFNAPYPPPNLHNSVTGTRHQFWQYYSPPPFNYRQRFQRHRGYPPRNLLPLPLTHPPPLPPKHLYKQGVNIEGAPVQNSKDTRLEVQNELGDQVHASSSGSTARYGVEKQKDMHSQSYGSRFQSNFHNRSNDSHNKYDDSFKSTEIRAQKDVRNEKPLMKKNVECTGLNQSKSERNGKQSTSTSESSLKSVPEMKSVNSAKAQPLMSKSGNLAAAKSPTFSNVVMQRMNARLHSFTKYGKMPTSGQIRHLALSTSSPVQEKADGKLQEWSKKINESHHNLTAQDKELINRLVNYPCSRREQKKLEYCIREHARSRKKLTLPRFNLQLSGIETCRDSPSVDDSVNSMATEVVDCLPEDVLNSLINALNSDVDENVTVDFPFDIDTHLPVPPEDEYNVHNSSGLKYSKKGLDEDVFITVDEVGGYSSCEETAEFHEEQHPDAKLDEDQAACHPQEKSGHFSSPKNQESEHSNIVTDHNYAVEATKQLVRGSSLEICESQKISDKRNLTADKEKKFPVEVHIKKNPLDSQDRNTKASSGCIESSVCRENADLAITWNSGNLKKTPPDSEGACVLVKYEKSESHAVGSVQTSSSSRASSSPRALSSLPCTSSIPKIEASVPVSTVIKSPSTERRIPKDPAYQTASASSNVEIKKEPLGNSYCVTSPGSVPLSLQTVDQRNDCHTQLIELINSTTEVKQEPTEQLSDIVPETTMEQNRENSGSRTIALGISLLHPSTFCKNTHILDNNCVKGKNELPSNHQNGESESIANGYPGLSWITKPRHELFDRTKEPSTSSLETAQVTSQPLSASASNIFTPSALRQNNHIQNASASPFSIITNQGFEDCENLTRAVEATSIKIEPHCNNKSEDTVHKQDDFTSLPKISCVTSIQNSENIIGCHSTVLEVYPTIEIKQEPSSPPSEAVNLCEPNNGTREESQVNCSTSKPTRTQPTETSSSAASAPQVNNQNHGSESDGIAASFPGVIHKAKPSTQIEDPEKTPEVSSSTGAFLLDEAQSASVIGTHHPGLNSKDGAPLDLIRELLSITSAEEKLVERVREAERTIAQLTASLEQWKRRKYEIEQEQMKLRMKRQELLLSAAQGSVSCDKRRNISFRSFSAAGDKTPDHDTTSEEEQQTLTSVPSASTLSDETCSESDSSWSQSLSRTHHTISSMRKRKKGKRGQRTKDVHARTIKRELQSSKKRAATDEPFSDSSAEFSNRSSKRKCRSFPGDDRSCSSERNPCGKKRHNMMNAQIVLQPLQLMATCGKKILVNDDDDVIVLEDSPRGSTESRENVDLGSSSEETETVQDIERSVTSREDIITTSTKPTPDPEFLVNIGILQAHSMAIVDLKVYDGYLYSCSIDSTAKRFSIKDPENDRTSYEGHMKTVTSICMSPFKEVYTTCNDGYLRCFARDSGVNIDSFKMKNGISCSCDGGGTLYLGLITGEVIFFSFRLKKVVYELNCANCGIVRLATVTQGAQRLLCVAANDGIVSLYDTATGLLLRCLEGRVQPPCCIKTCDNHVYISTSEKIVLVHDLLSGKLERMMNWAASATGLEIIDNFILTSSYDGLIRCHDKNQDMLFHSLYYGAGKGTVMSMTAYKEWIFTGNRSGVVEVFKFDPSKQLPCQYGRCRQNFGRECDVLHHVTIDHLPCVNLKTKTCPWRTCSYTFTPRTTIEEKKVHVTEHLISVH